MKMCNQSSIVHTKVVPSYVLLWLNNDVQATNEAIKSIHEKRNQLLNFWTRCPPMLLSTCVSYLQPTHFTNNLFLHRRMDYSRSDTPVDIMEVSVVSLDSIGEECAFREDRNVDAVAISIGFLMLLTLRSMKSLIIAGLLIFSDSTSVSPVSMAMTFDISGRCLVTSCVHKSPIFRNLQACATSKSSPKELSMIFFKSPCS